MRARIFVTFWDGYDVLPTTDDDPRGVEISDEIVERWESVLEELFKVQRILQKYSTDNAVTGMLDQ